MPELKKKINALVILAVIFSSITTTAKSQAPPLYLAIESGDVDVVKGLLDQGANVNQIYKLDKYSIYTPLIDAVIAAKKNGTAGTQIVKILLNKGADVNGGTGFNPSPPLYEAIFADNTEVVKILLDNGAKIDGKDNLGFSPLMWAAERGQAGIVQILLEKGADVNVKINVKNEYGAKGYAQWEYGQTALFLASNLSIAKILLAHDADILVKDIKGQTVLDLVNLRNQNFIAAGGSLGNEAKEFPQFLLRFQSEGNNQDGKAHKEAAYENLGVTLIEAIRGNNLKDVLSSIEKGADVNFISGVAGSYTDCTPTSLAAKMGSVEILKTLLEKGADMNVKNRDGKPFLDLTYLDIAYATDYTLYKTDPKNMHKYYSPEVKNLLKEHGKKIVSPLYAAIEQGDNKMVKALLEQGVDINQPEEISDFDAKIKITPIIYAMRHGKTEIMKILLAHGADISGDDTINGGLYAFVTMVMGYATDSLAKERDAFCKDKDVTASIKCFGDFAAMPEIKKRQDEINKKEKEILNVLREWYIQKKGCLPATFIVWSEDAWYMDLKLLAKVCDPNAKIGTAGFGIDNLLVRVAMPTNGACTDLLIAKGADIDEAIKSCRAVMANVEKYNANNPALLKVWQDKIDFLERKKKK